MFVDSCLDLAAVDLIIGLVWVILVLLGLIESVGLVVVVADLEDSEAIAAYYLLVELDFVVKRCQ